MSLPRPRRPGQFELGASCPHCSAVLEAADRVVSCPRCGISQHESCWGMHDGCGSYHCLQGARMEGAGPAAAPDLVVTAEDLDAARPGPAAGARPRFAPPEPEPAVPDRTSRLALWSFGLGLAGVVLLGCPGAVAAVLGGMALARITASRGRLGGTGWAVAGIAVGILSTIGWIVAGAVWFDGRSDPFHEEFPREIRLDGLPAPIAEAMRQNVKIEATRDSGSLLRSVERWIGSGVVVARTGERVTLLTNRHVALGQDGADDDERPGLRVRFIDGGIVDATVRWLAPDGVDLALLECPVPAEGAVVVARMRVDEPLRVGDPLFAVGSPHGMGWTFTRGTVSGFSSSPGGARRDVEVIQTQTPISPGSSGGGLYTEDGLLVGVNTWTVGGLSTEGLHFAIGTKGLAKLLAETGEVLE